MRCRPDNPRVRCAWREAEVKAGRMRYLWGHGWVWDRARRPMVTWDVCPGCGGRLADLADHAVSVVEGWLRTGDWPTYDGEDGHGE